MGRIEVSGLLWRSQFVLLHLSDKKRQASLLRSPAACRRRKSAFDICHTIEGPREEGATAVEEKAGGLEEAGDQEREGEGSIGEKRRTGRKRTRQEEAMETVKT